MSLSAKGSALEGNLFLMIATFGAVMNTVIFKKVLKEINFYQVTFISFLFGALNFFPLMYIELQQWPFSLLDYRGWIGIIFGVIFPPPSLILYIIMAYQRLTPKKSEYLATSTLLLPYLLPFLCFMNIQLSIFIWGHFLYLLVS